MAISIDVSGLEQLQKALQLDLQALNRKFMEDEGHEFLDKVTGPEHPIDTGLAEKSWAVNDDIKQEGNVTESTWKNTAKNEQGKFYLGFVNWGVHGGMRTSSTGLLHHHSGMNPRLFFEKAINRVNESRGQRYRMMFKEAFDGALK